VLLMKLWFAGSTRDETTAGRNELAEELFTADHVMHDPQVPSGPGPQGMVDTVRPYQDAVNGHWGIEEIFSADDRVIVRWTGTGTHVGEINGIAPDRQRDQGLMRSASIGCRTEDR